MADKDYFSEKSFKLDKITITSTTGEVVDIYSLMTELTIYEDIYNSTLSGKIIISDSQDLMNRIPLLGFEYLTIKVTKPGSERQVLFEKVFRVYKLVSEGVAPGTTTGQVYNLYFCSEENIISLSRKISKSYRSKTSTFMINDILKNELVVSPTKLLPQNIEDTIGLYDIIIPYMNPLHAISWIAGRSKSAQAKIGGATFMFYENTQGYNFKSLETLFYKPTKAKYSYGIKNSDTGDESSLTEIRDAIKFEFMNVFDTLTAISSGMYSSVLKTVDLTRLKFSDVVLSYNSYFNDTTHLQNDKELTKKVPYQFQNESKDRLNNKIYENYFALRRMYPTNFGHDTVPSISRKQPSIKPNLVEKWMLQRISQINQLNYFKLKIVIPGDTYITIGDIIEFNVPLLSTKVKGEPNINPFYSGRYLITAIRHKIDQESYEMIIEATKDCVTEIYPSAKNDDPILKEIKKL